MLRRRNALTSNAGKKLSSKALNLAAGEWCEAISLEKIKHAHAEQVRNDANVRAIVEALSKVNTLVAILAIVHGQSGQHTKLDF